jgi:hypothetical protein
LSPLFERAPRRALWRKGRRADLCAVTDATRAAAQGNYSTTKRPSRKRRRLNRRISGDCANPLALTMNRWHNRIDGKCNAKQNIEEETGETKWN